jgi:thiosulfate reductase cytochrome b subunit
MLPDFFIFRSGIFPLSAGITIYEPIFFETVILSLTDQVHSTEYKLTMSKQLEYKHSLATRWMHWINFPVLAMMVWSGLLIYWANAVYAIKVFGTEYFHFFPTWFYDTLGIPFRLAEGIQLHFFFMWLFALNGIVYVLYTIVSGEWRALLPIPSSFKRAPIVALRDMHIVKELPLQGKYNDAQRIAYTAVIVMGAGSIVTGLAIYKPLQLAWLTGLLGGYEWARWEHFWLMAMFVAFFGVHVIQVALAGWSNFRSMITGRELVNSDLPEPVAASEVAV